MKRFFDVIFALIALLVTMPIMLIVGIFIMARMGVPIFFRQTRPGLQGKPFEMIKFRTMVNEIDARGERLPDEQRLTQLGRLLRSSSLDELPELWNVVKGDMSLVGPRPLLMEYLPRYSPDQLRRHEVRPGITGWAQVNGRNALSWEEKFALDLWYVENRNFLLDLKIMLITAWKVLQRDGISHEGEATMGEFIRADDDILSP